MAIFVLPFAPKAATTPYRLTTASWRRAPADCHPYQAKTSSTYAISFLSFRDKDEAFDDVLFLSTNDTVCESSGSNIFFVKGSQLITPTTEMALAGITRRVIIDELCPVLDLQVIQRDISSSELGQFDGAFLCGTAMEITEISCIDGVHYERNQWVELLANQYRKSVIHTALIFGGDSPEDLAGFSAAEQRNERYTPTLADRRYPAPDSPPIPPA